MRRFAVAALLLSVAAAPVPPPAVSQVPVPPTTAPPPSVTAWTARHAVPVGPLDLPPSKAEAAAIDRITDGATVIALGESNHGNAEPLDYRNRLIRYLVEHRGLTAVALESGLAESRPLYDYVLGAPGDGAAVVRAGLTHGFGQLAANRALAEWLRGWNRDHPRQRVRIYGIDRSTIQSGPPGMASVVLGDIIDYLDRTVPAQSTGVRKVLKLYANRFDETTYRSLPESDRRSLTEALAASEALFREQRTAMLRASSADAYDWAAREAYDAARLRALFDAWVDDASDLPRLKRLIDLRDGAMADHVLWVLKREGPHARVLLFQANGHVTAAPMVGSVMRDFAEQPLLTGIVLRRALGDRYRVIGTASSRGRRSDDAASGSVDRALATVGTSPALLALRSADRPSWWSQVQTASQGENRLDDMVPAQAFDGIVYFARLTALPPPAP